MRRVFLTFGGAGGISGCWYGNSKEAVTGRSSTAHRGTHCPPKKVLPPRTDSLLLKSELFRKNRDFSHERWFFIVVSDSAHCANTLGWNRGLCVCLESGEGKCHGG